ncbi:MAG: hypothetical protein JNM39_05325 [Bdellovibrionaceae bacterium]|nr:hypothetical protein [Pseudobdellovibrionaceae bacterium]
MGMLDRYKKKSGFAQLITLIETSSKQKQDQFLSLIGQEDSAWESALRSKLLTVDRILRWPADVLVEIFSRVQPLTLAVAFHGNTPEKLDQLFGCLSNTEKRKLLLMMSELNPTPAEKTSCLIKLIAEVRGFANQGIIKLEKFDHEMAIPENYEEKIHQASLESKQKEEAPPALVFPGDPDDSGRGLRDSQGLSVKDSGGKENGNRDASGRDEIEHLKKKVTQVNHENATLKHEIQVLKNKLEQIRKIA